MIVEAYKDYQPPPKLREAITSLLACVPQEYFYGLKEIVLLEAKSLPRNRRHDRLARGIYHQQWAGQSAWIEILVDICLEGWPAFLTRSQVFLTLALAEVLYHEIGHHKLFLTKSTPGDSERVAKQIASNLSKKFFRKRYWYLYPFMYACGLVYRSVTKSSRKNGE